MLMIDMEQKNNTVSHCVMSKQVSPNRITMNQIMTRPKKEALLYLSYKSGIKLVMTGKKDRREMGEMSFIVSAAKKEIEF
jgi:hypothetical protein